MFTYTYFDAEGQVQTVQVTFAQYVAIRASIVQGIPEHMAVASACRCGGLGCACRCLEWSNATCACNC